jgi:hypothetical protein
MMEIDIISNITSGITSNIGSTLIAAVFFFIAAMLLLSVVLNIEPIYALVLSTIPFILMVIMLSFSVAWALGVVVLLLGFVLATAMYKMFIR